MIYARPFGAAPQKECWRCHNKFPTLTRVYYVSGLVKDSWKAASMRTALKGSSRISCKYCNDENHMRHLIDQHVELTERMKVRNYVQLVARDSKGKFMVVKKEE